MLLPKLLAPLAILANISGCLTQSVGLCRPLPDSNECRPFRTGLVKFSEELDAVKPLVPIDVSGWTLSSGILIGAVDEQWLAGYSLKERKVVWWHPTPGGVTTPIHVFGGWVIVGERDGHLTKVEAASGKKVWEATLSKFTPRPLALGGATLVAITANQQVYGLDFLTGKTLWLYDAGAPDNVAIRTSAPALLRDRLVFVGTDKGEVHALALETGKLEWRYNPQYSESRFHDVVGEMVTVGTQLVSARYDGSVTAINLSNAEHSVVWKDSLPAVTNTTFRGGILFVGCLNGDVYALEASTGRRLWRISTYASVGTLTAGEKVLYVAGTNGRINAIDIAQGTLLWHDDIAGAIDANPIITGEQIYFATGLKVLYGYQLL